MDRLAFLSSFGVWVGSIFFKFQDYFIFATRNSTRKLE